MLLPCDFLKITLVQAVEYRRQQCCKNPDKIPFDIIIEESHMKNRDIYQLTHISLILKQINLPTKEMDRLSDMPIFRIEVWQDNTLLDQTCDIVASLNQKEHTLKLAISSASFKYKKGDLFSFQKVAKLSLKLYRVDQTWKEEQFVDDYKLILSEYAYQYSRSITATINQHVVGFKKRSFLYYTVQCFYQDRVNKENQSSTKLIKIPKLRKNEKSLNQNSSPLRKLDNGLYPLKSISFDQRPQKQQEEVFISYNKLVPIYASDRIDHEEVRIKLNYSQIKIDGQKDNSVLEQVEKMKKSAQHFKKWFFYFFILMAIVEILVLMNPRTKIK